MAVVHGESVYLLWFTRESSDGEDELLIGVYRNEEDATLP
jgi:hypothetical protein